MQYGIICWSIIFRLMYNSCLSRNCLQRAAHILHLLQCILSRHIQVCTCCYVNHDDTSLVLPRYRSKQLLSILCHLLILMTQMYHNSVPLWDNVSIYGRIKVWFKCVFNWYHFTFAFSISPILHLALVPC